MPTDPQDLYMDHVRDFGVIIFLNLKVLGNIMKTFSIIMAAVILSLGAVCTSRADELADLFNLVEKLNIGRDDYTLSKVLTDNQKRTAQDNAQEKASPGTYKFKDKDLHIVADKVTDRVIILYERYESVSAKKIRELVGALFFDFGDPTVMAHDKTIYWAFDENGKISEEQYREAKATKKPLKTLATAKLDSSHKIMDGSDPGENSSVYYIISSEPMLKRLNSRAQ